MSSEAIGYVFAYSPTKGATFACHLAIADSVNDQHGNEFWMSVTNLARKARCSRDAARKALRALEGCDGSGERIDGAPVLLEVLEERLGETTRYRFLMPDLPRLSGATPSRQGRGLPRLSGATPPASHKRLSQGGTQDGTQGDPAVDAAGDDVSVRARGICAAVWEQRSPKPATPYIGAVKITERLLAAGHADDAVLAAMLAAPTLSTGAIELQLSRGRRVIPLRRPLDGDRAAGSGRLDL